MGIEKTETLINNATTLFGLSEESWWSVSTMKATMTRHYVHTGFMSCFAGSENEEIFQESNIIENDFVEFHQESGVEPNRQKIVWPYISFKKKEPILSYLCTELEPFRKIFFLQKTDTPSILVSYT